MFKNLCDLLKTQVVHGNITSNGSCFLHALEYALGNCDMIPNRQDLYQKTRREVATFAIEKLNQQKETLLAEFNAVHRTPEEIVRFYETFEERLDFLEQFKANNAFSNEDIVQYAALLKGKILCIVEEKGENRMSLICPDIPFRKENILFLVHSDGIHYESFEYPIHVSDEMVYALKHLQGVDVMEHTMKLKEFTLQQLLSFIVTTRIRRRRNEPITNLSPSRTRKRNELIANLSPSRRRKSMSKTKSNSKNKNKIKIKSKINSKNKFLNPKINTNTIRIHKNSSRSSR
jgi:hypothetical protein